MPAAMNARCMFFVSVAWAKSPGRQRQGQCAVPGGTATVRRASGKAVRVLDAAQHEAEWAPLIRGRSNSQVRSSERVAVPRLRPETRSKVLPDRLRQRDAGRVKTATAPPTGHSNRPIVAIQPCVPGFLRCVLLRGAAQPTSNNVLKA